MRLRNFLIIAIGIIAVAAAVVLLLPALQPAPTPVDPGTAVDPVAQLPAATVAPIETPLPTPTPIKFIDLVIAVQELPRGIIIPFDAVQLRPWVADIAPFNAITNLEDVIGKRARTDIFREQPILSNMVVDDLTEIARVGSDAAAVLPDGLVAISMPIDRLTSIAYAVQDGDRVDLIISLLFVDVDEEFQSLSPNAVTLITRNPETNGFELSLTLNGRPESTSLGQGIISPSEPQRPRLVVQRTIQDALVVHVGNFPIGGRFIGIPPTPTPVPVEEEKDGNEPPPPTPTPPRPDIITLGVPIQEAVELVWLIEARVPVTLALRSARDNVRTTTTQVTLDYMMTNYAINLPGTRPYTIEPATRSIRQLLAGDAIRLTDNTQ